MKVVIGRLSTFKKGTTSDMNLVVPFVLLIPAKFLRNIGQAPVKMHVDVALVEYLVNIFSFVVLQTDYLPQVKE